MMLSSCLPWREGGGVQVQGGGGVGTGGQVRAKMAPVVGVVGVRFGPESRDRKNGDA